MCQGDVSRGNIITRVVFPSGVRVVTGNAHVPLELMGELLLEVLRLNSAELGRRPADEDV